ncbi:MAG: hypothetical protein H7839_00955 [Magnetococcus sp. YQC-5]
MSSSLFDLREMLTGRVSMAGKVVSIANGVARVATPEGVAETVADGSMRVGDRVTVRDGRAVRVQDGVDAPVFFV